MSGTDRLISWLNDALTMEIELVPILSDHATDARAFPGVPEVPARACRHSALHSR